MQKWPQAIQHGTIPSNKLETTAFEKYVMVHMCAHLPGEKWEKHSSIWPEFWNRVGATAEFHLAVIRPFWRWACGPEQLWAACTRPSHPWHIQTSDPVRGEVMMTADTQRRIINDSTAGTWSPAPTSSSFRSRWTPWAMSGDCCSRATSTLQVL